jgi:DNA-binding transcriptional LysR family regulator
VYAKRALRDAEEAHSRINDLQGLRRGQISLASVAATADSRLMDLIVKFQATYPKIGFSLSVMGTDKVVNSVLDHDADLGLAFNPSPQTDFHELASRGFSVCAIVARDHPLAQNHTVSIFALPEFPLAMADRSWGGRRLLDEFLGKTGLKLQPRLVSNSFEVLTDFIRRTNGVCFQIRPGPGAQALENDLVALPIVELRRYERRVVLGSLRGRVLPVAAALFCETLKQELFNSPQVAQ